MPMYDQDCPSCGVHEVFCSMGDRHTCQRCQTICTLRPGRMHPIGIIFANAETNKQLGVTWNSNSEKRAWMKAHPNVHGVASGSTEDNNFKGDIREKADSVIRSHGYKDVQEFKREATKKEVSKLNG